VRYVPVPIIIGFTNGIAVLIALSQVKDLLGLHIEKMPSDFFAQIESLSTHLGSFKPTALAIGLACLAIVVLWPKSYTMPTAPAGWWGRLRRLAAHLPGTVVALALATAATALLRLPVETIGSRFGGIPQSLPDFALPAFSWATAKLLVFPTLTIAMLGAIESLLCARVADNATDLPRHDPNQELMAQGIANFVAPFFGGIPATGTIARTITNVRAGAVSPVAGIVHSLALLAIVLLAAPLAVHVPLAALAGILLFVAWNMGEWHEFARLHRFSPQYRTILVGTFTLTVVFDLTVAVEVGWCWPACSSSGAWASCSACARTAPTTSRRACSCSSCTARCSSVRSARWRRWPSSCPTARARWCSRCTGWSCSTPPASRRCSSCTAR